jgi:pilus assembly protein Flp/PilA
MVEFLRGLFIEEEGQGMTEYGLILGLIAVGVIATLMLLGDQIAKFFTDLTSKLPGGTTTS